MKVLHSLILIFYKFDGKVLFIDLHSDKKINKDEIGKRHKPCKSCGHRICKEMIRCKKIRKIETGCLEPIHVFSHYYPSIEFVFYPERFK